VARRLTQGECGSGRAEQGTLHIGELNDLRPRVRPRTAVHSCLWSVRDRRRSRGDLRKCLLHRQARSLRIKRSPPRGSSAGTLRGRSWRGVVRGVNCSAAPSFQGVRDRVATALSQVDATVRGVAVSRNPSLVGSSPARPISGNVAVQSPPGVALRSGVPHYGAAGRAIPPGRR
jgi:hypothetical protein